MKHVNKISDSKFSLEDMLRLKKERSPSPSIINQSQVNTSIENSGAKSLEVVAMDHLSKIYATQQNSIYDKKSFEYTFASTTARLTKNYTSTSKR